MVLFSDERFWKPELDKSGNGFATQLSGFLPAPDGEDLPWAKIWSHAFKGPGGQWYIENSLTTLGKDDPVGEMNRELWNSGRDRWIRRLLAHRSVSCLTRYSNIYVVSDPAHPENEASKSFCNLKFGKKIFDKLTEAMQPAFADETPIDPFNFWKGADFKLKIRKVEGYWNYDKSEFAAPSTLGNFDDDKLESIWKQGYSLAEFEDAKNFKTYEQLKARLDLVLGKTAPAARPIDESLEDESEGRGSFNSPDITGHHRDTMMTSNQVNLIGVLKSKTSREKAVAASPVADEEDTLSYFAKLAEED